MQRRKQEKITYQERPFYDGRVQTRTVSFILAIMFGTGGGMDSGSGAFRAAVNNLSDIDEVIGELKGFWHDAPIEWLEMWRLMLFDGLNNAFN